MAVTADSSLCCCCSGDAGTFADAGNLEHCAKYLNQTLVTFGFPASLDLFATDPVRHSRLLAFETMPSLFSKQLV